MTGLELLLGAAIAGLACLYGLIRLESITNPPRLSDLAWVDLPQALRELAAPLHHRGTLLLSHASVRGQVWLWKHVRSGEPDELRLRFRNTGDTEPHFDDVVEALDRERVRYELEPHPDRPIPRSVIIGFDTDVPASFSAVGHIVRICFTAMGAGAEQGITACALDTSNYSRMLEELDDLPAGPRRFLLRRLLKKLVAKGRV